MAKRKSAKKTQAAGGRKTKDGVEPIVVKLAGQLGSLLGRARSKATAWSRAMPFAGRWDTFGTARPGQAASKSAAAGASRSAAWEADGEAGSEEAGAPAPRTRVVSLVTTEQPAVLS
jgi:hypothetical protein